jgi:hypothetical protein
MEDTIIAISIIAAIVSIITMIVFFVMAANVAKIKRTLDRAEPAIPRYLALSEEEAYIGNREKAKEYLLRTKFHISKSDAYNVLINGVWVTKINLLKSINSKLRGLVDIDEAARIPSLVEGELVVEVATGKQMVVAETTPDGTYKCTDLSGITHILPESEIMGIDNWVKATNEIKKSHK